MSKSLNALFKLSWLLFLFVFISSCCKDNDEIQPDPCAQINPVSAAFKIEEQIQGAYQEKRRYEVDTVVAGTTVFFTANEEDATYEWLVGADTTRHRTKSFTLQFPAPVGPVDVRLIVKKEPNLACHPNDTGIDTVTKRLYIAPESAVPYKGRFEGYNASNPGHKFIIEIKMNEQNVLENGIYNFPEGCPDHIQDGTWGNTAAYIWTNWSVCKHIKAWAHLSANSQEITIEYKYFHYENNDPSANKGEWRTDVFKGKRI